MSNTDEYPSEPESFHALRTKEQELLRERRRIAVDTAGSDDDLSRPTVGVALSGGGIRSATFCFGLLRGLAQNKLLHRVDYLSTVSGGGFIGATLGRLIMAIGLKRAQETMADSGSLLMWWLRSNGRYLTPSGSRDRAMAMVTYFRAWVAVQLEFGVMCIALALLVMLPHLMQNTTSVLNADRWSPWGSWWFPIALLLQTALLPGVLIAYWFAKDAPTRVAGHSSARASASSVEQAERRTGSPVYMVLGLLISALLLCGLAFRLKLPATGANAGSAFEAFNMLMLAAAGTSFCVGLTLWKLPPLTARTRALRAAEVRNSQTRWLRGIFLAGVMLLGMGAVDCSSWMLMRLASSPMPDSLSPWGSAGGLAVLLILLRVFSDSLSKTAKAGDGSQWDTLGPKLLNLAGIVFALLIFVGWTSLLQYVVFQMQAQPAHGSVPNMLIAAGLVLAWILWSGRNADTANASSLHSFYRARLTRSYLSVGNVGEGKRFPAIDEAATDRNIAEVRRVTEVVDGDDLGLASYQPERFGGPIHLVNACLNQTREDGSGLYNADRKGMMLTATARGFELGRQRFVPLTEETDAGTLGRWVAISGGAVSPGAGSYTTRGWAAMLFLLGVRLGYWIHAEPTASRPPRKRLARWSAAIERFSWRALPKIKMLRAEFGARYFGTAKSWWYLSDGAHFENTGVYPLLRRELDFILLADCGADPQFDLKDIETLVRKARLDFGAEIRFHSQESVKALWPESQRDGGIRVLSLDELADNRADRGVLLAHIAYAARGREAARSGTLLIVKPNLHNRLDIDLLAYARRNPAFPQQSTSNQFFDESQWESYQRLGEDFGRALSGAWLDTLPGWSKPVAAGSHPPLDNTANASTTTADKEKSASVPFWRRGASAAAVGATLGVGATGTLLLATVQLTDHFSKRADQITNDARTAYSTVRDALATPSAASLGKASDASKTLIKVAAVGLSDRALLARIEDLARDADNKCANPDTASAVPDSDNASALRTFCDSWVRERNEWTRADLMYGYWINGYKESAVGMAAQPTPAAGVFAVSKRMTQAPAKAETAPALNYAAFEQLCTPRQKIEATEKPKILQAEDYPKEIRLFPHVYDESTKVLANKLRQKMEEHKPANFFIQATENVTASAISHGRRSPYQWPQPTLIVHKVTEHQCAMEISKLMSSLDPGLWQNVRVMPLPSDLRQQPGVIELWLPPEPAPRIE